MQVPEIRSNFRIYRHSGNLNIRKEYGTSFNRYVLSIGHRGDTSTIVMITQEEMDRLGEYINENKDPQPQPTSGV
tara:strand:+ start:1753 stop:1977 length:225 start_codon:yes stop_codon:yes gene_type:complete